MRDGAQSPCLLDQRYGSAYCAGLAAWECNVRNSSIMPLTWLGKTKTIHRLGFALSAVITAMVLVVLWFAPALLMRLEGVSLDLRFKLRGVRPVGQEIVIVAIDEPSIQEIGRWPWSRTTQAKLVDAISRDNPSVIGLDILYTEPEEPGMLQHLTSVMAEAKAAGATSPRFEQLLQRKLAEANPDRLFAQSLQHSSKAVLALLLNIPKAQVAPASPAQASAIPDSVKRSQFMLVKDSRSGQAMEPFQATTMTPPLQLFAEAAMSLGHVYSIPDPDGVTRTGYLALRYGNAQDYYPALAVEVARSYLGVPREQMILTLGLGLQLGDVFIPMDQKARMVLNYIGPERSFPYVSAADVLHGRVSSGTFSGKTVLVGTTALGTYDQKATPFSANFSGVEQNATVVENILHRQFLQKTVWSGPLDIAAIVFFGLFLGYCLPRIGAIPGTVTTMLALLGYAGATHYFFVAHGLWLELVTPLVTVGTVFVAVTVLRFMTVEKEKDEIRRLFTPYVGPQIVQQLIQNPTQAGVDVRQRRKLTMLFCDIVSFTAFCERHDARDVVTQVNEYLQAMTEVVLRWNGTLVDFQGDQIYAFWGAPAAQPDHAELGLKCALHLRKRLAELHMKWTTEGKTLLDNGIGLNTGEVLVAHMGAPGKRMKYAAVGDHVNLAARISGLTRHFKVPLLLSEFTAAEAKRLAEIRNTSGNTTGLGHIALKRLASVKVKGKDAPVGIYELVTLDHSKPSHIEETAQLETIEMTEK